MFTKRCTQHVQHVLYHTPCNHFSSSPISTCIIGSGPSGLYTAKYLLKKVSNIQVSIVDELPTPFGLVRYGVAPDHADTKNVINDFTDSVLNDHRVSYFGNVKLNRDITLQQLQSIYDVVVLAYGANSDRKLGIEGEGMKGIYSSRQFVNWYNGHPRFINTITDSDFTQNKSGNIIIIGQGNVAIDCARILASSIDKLSKTDITQHALQKLKQFEKYINNIYIVGRRGAVQASFTNKELREVISGMNDDCIAAINKQEMMDSTENDASQQEISARAVKRKMAVFEQAVLDDSDVVLNNEEKPCVHFRFLLSPKQFIGDEDGRVQRVVFERNQLSGNANEQKAIGTGVLSEIEAGLVLTSIGYKAESIEQIADVWDTSNHTVKHKNGKINDDGLYCSGWLKRGPSGIIGTNIPDAQQTVKSIVEDYSADKFSGNDVDSVQAANNLEQWLNGEEIQFVDKNGWFLIDEYEKDIGAQKGKMREKVVNVDDMVKIANGVEI